MPINESVNSTRVCTIERYIKKVNTIYETCSSQDDFLRATLISLPKKNRAMSNKEYRTINLVSYFAKNKHRKIMNI